MRFKFSFLVAVLIVSMFIMPYSFLSTREEGVIPTGTIFQFISNSSVVPNYNLTAKTFSAIVSGENGTSGFIIMIVNLSAIMQYIQWDDLVITDIFENFTYENFSYTVRNITYQYIDYEWDNSTNSTVEKVIWSSPAVNITLQYKHSTHYLECKFGASNNLPERTNPDVSSSNETDEGTYTWSFLFQELKDTKKLLFLCNIVFLIILVVWLVRKRRKGG